MTTAEDAKNSFGIGNGRTRLIGFAVAALILWHGLGSAVDQAGMVGLGFASPYRSSDAMSDEAIALAATGDTENALRIARKAIQQQPVHQSSVRILAEIESGLDTPLLDTLGNPHLKTVGLLGWRDSQSQAKLMMVGLSEADRPLVIDRMDALLRRREISSESFQLVSLMLGDAELRGLLADRLLENPPWRSELFAATPKFANADAANSMGSMLVDLMAGGAQISDPEKAAVYASLLTLGQTDTLARVAEEVDEETQRDGINDAAFVRFATLSVDTEETTNPFAWQYGSAKRTVVSVNETGGPEGRSSLFVRTSSRVTAPAVTQTLRLSPGSYRMSMLRRSGQNDELTWIVGCLDQSLGQSRVPEGRESDDWSLSSFEFRIPEAGCPVQQLMLQTGRNLGGRSQQAEFADLQIRQQ